jgi:hypothetical protein
VPNLGLHQPWLQFYPGFAWTPLGLLIGLAESFLYGFVSGLVFAPIANFYGISRPDWATSWKMPSPAHM